MFMALRLIERLAKILFKLLSDMEFLKHVCKLVNTNIAVGFVFTLLDPFEKLPIKNSEYS